MPNSLRSRFTAILLSSLLFAPLSAYCWGPEGHKMVGGIASQFLSPQAEQHISDLLADDLNAQGAPSGRTTLGEVASWSDEIRSTAKGKGVAPWHFDDMPVCGSAPK